MHRLCATFRANRLVLVYFLPSDGSRVSGRCLSLALYHAMSVGDVHNFAKQAGSEVLGVGVVTHFVIRI